MHFRIQKKAKAESFFCKTKPLNKLSKNLAINRFHLVPYGSLSQGIRDRIMEQFHEGHINILVATDLAARGDVKEISYVPLPDAYESYVCTVQVHFRLEQDKGR
jgi:ATP-dependent RNA helicase DeaD